MVRRFRLDCFACVMVLMLFTVYVISSYGYGNSAQLLVYYFVVITCHWQKFVDMLFRVSFCLWFN